MSNESVKDVPWSVRQRLEFIEFRVCWEGKVNRGDLTNHFKISVPQASGDISRYREIAPNNLEYDSSAKNYIAAKGFDPIFNISPERYLTQLLAIESEVLPLGASNFGTVPELGVVHFPSRTVNAETLKSLLKAIREKLNIEISYQSLNGSPKRRWISPHALGFDGFRWHVRARCHNDNLFKDFVIGRFIEIHSSSSGGGEESDLQDEKWNTYFDLIIKANPGLPEEKRKSIELDYNMESGTMMLKTRLALSEYLLKRLGIGKDSANRKPEEQHIVLENMVELEESLGKKIFF